jgi:hypothetical protein
VRSVNTINGRIELRRTRYFAPGIGSNVPVDRLVDAAEAAVSIGVRELCCQQGTDCRSMARAARNLKASAGVLISEETLRKLVESEGKAVLALEA